MIVVKSADLSEKQLAEVALAIQNRWNIATFVKMHEIVLLDDEDIEDDEEESGERVITMPLDPDHFESGFQVILENLDMERGFRLQREGKEKFRLLLTDEKSTPTWMKETEVPRAPPEGVYECPHCVLPDTVILGDNKPILRYEPGNNALGESGLNGVTQTFVRSYKGNLITLKPNGMLEITTTPEHPLLVSESNSFGRSRGSGFFLSEPKWVKAKDILPRTTYQDGHYVIVPILKGDFVEEKISLVQFIKKAERKDSGFQEYFPISLDTAWLLGLYTAKGSVSREVRFSLNILESEIGQRIVFVAKELGHSTYSKLNVARNSMLVSLTSRVLARAFDFWCGHRAHNKKIPDFVLFHRDANILRAFPRGYEAGDSCAAINKRRGNKEYRQCNTASRILAQQLQLSYARLRIWADISFHSKNGEGNIMGRKVSSQISYFVTYPLVPNPKTTRVRFLSDKILCPVRSIEVVTYEGNVHNISTTDETYLVSNAIVHNCGKWFRTEIERNLHQKLHYLI